MRCLLSLAALSQALLVQLACTGSSSTLSEPDSNIDALPCNEQAPLTIGQCIDLATGAPCLDHRAKTRSWQSIESNPLVQPIIGLQGSPMFVLSVQGAKISLGSESQSPYVQLVVSDMGTMEGSFAARPMMIPVPNSTPKELIAPQLYVVAFFAEELVNKTVQVKAVIKDWKGNQWCKEGQFKVGELIDAPPTH